MIYRTVVFTRGCLGDMLGEKAGVPVGADWIAEMEAYEEAVLSMR